MGNAFRHKLEVDKQQQLEGMCVELQAANSKGNFRQLFQIVKSMTRKFHPRLRIWTKIGTRPPYADGHVKKVAHTRLPSVGRRVPELIPVLGSQPEGDVSHKPGGRLPLLSARPAVTPATLRKAATSFAAW